jgi:cellulose synthase/poly-beta-1,6-N-acetylglucosamine synthase-like glycosyltransferase
MEHNSEHPMARVVLVTIIGAGSHSRKALTHSMTQRMTMLAGWILLLLPIALALYAYGAYPLILRLLPRSSSNRAPRAAQPWPIVSIVVPAYNEERQIRGAIEALLAQDYPADRRQIVILSDASTDRTDEIVLEYRDQGVELLRMPVRGGKTAAENASSSVLRGEIVVNSDSSVRLERTAVRRLVSAMADPSVGVASTRDVSVTNLADTTNAAEAGYVGYEMRIRALETECGGIVGASGSGYAIRHELHRLPVRVDLSRDFSAALTAHRHGYKAVSVEDAVCYVPRTPSIKIEYRRKVRTIARGMETLLHNGRLLDPIRHGAFAWKLLSHKVCRWLVPPSALLAVIGLALLANRYAWAGVLIVLGLLVVIAAWIGSLWPSDRPLPRALSLLTFATAANVAVIHAMIRVTAGHEDHLWEPTRRAVSEARSPGTVA